MMATTAQRLIAQLEREQYSEWEHDEPVTNAYVRGFNDRTRSLIALLRVEQGLEELTTAPAQTSQDMGDVASAFEVGGEG